ncbi:MULTISPECIES: paraquat-inducible protein A [Enterobacteriaceae]|uniref:paraquat-inducible protein A n=1 Tax=Enterobacteriaceae TaxID=543 RepID=UPI000237D262|nr:MULTISPECIES: paraquat-inducible protein A [Enterobacteriaceae]
MLAICITAIIVFILANAYPLVTLEAQGMSRHTSLLEAVVITWNQPGLWGLALMSLFVGFIFPLSQLLLWLLSLLQILFFLKKTVFFALLTRWGRLLQPWSMLPVFFLGVLVAVIKIAGMAKIIIGPGLWAMAILLVLLTLLSRLDSRLLWRFAEDAGLTHANGNIRVKRTNVTRLVECHICGFSHELRGSPDDDNDAIKELIRCERCASLIHLRKVNSIARTWAFLLTGMLLYFPANILPIMKTMTLFSTSEHTILGGVVELWRGGAPDIAIVVFIASIAVPLIKFTTLIMLLISVHHAQNRTKPNKYSNRYSWLMRLLIRQKNDEVRSIQNRRTKTQCYRFIEFIGQWSMLDVFVVLLLAALVNFQGLMQVTAGMGAIAFGATVCLTMLASLSFDPRLLWDDEFCNIKPSPALTTSHLNAEKQRDIEQGDSHARNGS